MLKIHRMDIDGLGGITQTLDMTQPTIMIGPNDAKKTTRLKALELALLGHIPGEGMRPMDVLRRASNGRVSIRLHTNAGIIERTYTRKGGTCAANVLLTCSEGRFTGEEAEALIKSDFATDPVYFDLSTVFSASPEKRREFLFGLCELDFNREEIADTLATYHEEAKAILTEAWPAEWDSATGLANAIEFFKREHSDTKKLVAERDRALKGAMDQIHVYAQGLPPGGAAEYEKRLAELQEKKAAIDAAIGAQAEAQKEVFRINNRKTAIASELAVLADPPFQIGRNRERLSVVLARVEAEIKASKPICKPEAVQTELKALQEKLDAVLKQLTEKRDSLKSAEDEERQARTRLDVCLSFLEAANASPDKCPTCGSEGEFKKAVKKAKEDRKALKQNLELQQQNVESVQGVIAELEETVQLIEADIEEKKGLIEDEAQRVIDLASAEERLAELKAKRTDADAKYSELTEELESLTVPEAKDYNADLNTINAQIAAVTVDIRKLTQRNALDASVESHRRDREAAQVKADAMAEIVQFLQKERGEAVQEASGALADDINAFLKLMDPKLDFSLQFEDERGKPCADMAIGGVPVELWGDGTRTLADAAIKAAIIMRKKSPCPILLIDRIETISNTAEEPRRQQLINALDKVKDRFSVIRLAGTEGVADMPEGWNVLEVGTSRLSLDITKQAASEIVADVRG